MYGDADSYICLAPEKYMSRDIAVNNSTISLMLHTNSILLSCYFVIVTTYVFTDILEELAHVRRKRNKKVNFFLINDILELLRILVVIRC